MDRESVSNAHQSVCRDGQGRIRTAKHRDKVLIGILNVNKKLINAATVKIKKTN